ncbi:Maltose O-acetyltransferase, partial [Pseudolycoriella hygida]
DSKADGEEQMLAACIDEPSNEQLDKERIRTKKLIRKFNDSSVEDEDKRNEILNQLFHQSCKNKKMFVEPPFRVEFGCNIIVGDNFQANFDCVILDRGKVTIGNNCLLACGVHIYTSTHPLTLNQTNVEGCIELVKDVQIGDNCWIGGQSVICPGVVIGDNVTVGAGSVVLDDVPSNVVVGGNPCKIIKYLPGANIPWNERRSSGTPKLTSFPVETDPKSYNHLTEKERMIAGYPHRIDDEELCRDSISARNICCNFNTKDWENPKDVEALLVVIVVEQPFRVDYGYNITIERNFFSHFDLVILDSTLIKIGKNCFVGPGVHIYATNHPLDPRNRKNDGNYYELAKPITIGNNVWIGGRVTFCPGVNVGNIAVVDVGSVVTKNIPANAFVSGNPARVIKENVNRLKK